MFASIAAISLFSYIYFNYIKLATIIYSIPMKTIGYTEDIKNAEQIIRDKGINRFQLIKTEGQCQDRKTGESWVQEDTFIYVCKADGQKASEALHAKKEQLKGDLYNY